jgi:hypothetical protein
MAARPNGSFEPHGHRIALRLILWGYVRAPRPNDALRLTGNVPRGIRAPLTPAPAPQAKRILARWSDPPKGEARKACAHLAWLAHRAAAQTGTASGGKDSRLGRAISAS